MTRSRLRAVPGLVVLALIGLVIVINLLRLAGDPSAPFGSDWRWYRDGADRLLSAAPLYDPRLLIGPYDQTQPGLEYTFNQAPTLAPVVTAFALAVPDALTTAAWSTLMAACLALAFILVWPRGASRTAFLVLGSMLLVSPAIMFGLWWANASCAVALGTALVIFGERRQRRSLVTAGLLLAGVAKILPAVPLALWLLVRRRGWRPVATAGAVGLALLGAVTAIEGPGVIGDFLVATGNALPVQGNLANVAPAALLAPIIGGTAASSLCFAVATGLAGLSMHRSVPEGWSLLGLLTAVCLVVPNLWVHWLIAPMVAAVALVGPRALRLLDLVPRKGGGGSAPAVSGRDGYPHRVPARRT